MNWYKVFYWMSVADNASTILGVIAVISAICVGVSIIGMFITTNSASEAAVAGGADKQTTTYNEYMIWVRAFKRTFTVFSIVGFITASLWMAIPSKKQMLGIIAGGAIGNFVTRDSSAKAIPSELTNYFRAYIRKEAEDLDVETKQELGIATPKESFLDKVKDMTKEELIEQIKRDTTLIK